VSLSLIVSLFFAAPSAIAQEKAINVWEPCEFTKTVPCIISVEAIGSDGKITLAKTDKTLSRSYTDYFATQPLFGNKHEWVTPGIKHENGTEHTIMKLFYFPLGTNYCWAEGQCVTNTDQIVFDFGGGWWDTPQTYTDFPELLDDRVCGTASNPTYCGTGWGLNPNYSYRVKAKLPVGFDFGFSVGYGKSGSIFVDKNSDGEDIMTINVTPAEKSFKWRKYFDIAPTDYQQKADITNNIVSSFLSGVSSVNTAWLSKCDYGRGMSIWSNGDVVQWPTWNSSDQSIQLQVAAMASKADGSRNQGTFEVAVPIKIAQCLWGVDLSKSATALISASYPELGITEVITTSSRVENGTYYLSANGFHYSSPTIKVKVVQNNPDPVIENKGQSTLESESKASTSVKVTSVKKKSTITCVKGKVTKKVIAVNPKCPTGYKKK
jgi:hypothetical protein